MRLPSFSFSNNQLKLWYRHKTNQPAMRFIAEFHMQAGHPDAVDRNISEVSRVLNKALENEDLKVDEDGILIDFQDR